MIERDDERRLVDGLVAGDVAVTREFLERTHDAVYAYACRLSADEDRRRDWVHDCLLRLVDDVRNERFLYRHPGSLWGWFRKRAYYLLLESYRRHRTHRDREVASEDLDSSPTEARVGDDELRRIEIAGAIEHCLEALENGDQRRALHHLLHDDLPYAEIAERMARPLNTVRAWIRRGRLSLRKCLVERLELAR